MPTETEAVLASLKRLERGQGETNKGIAQTLVAVGEVRTAQAIHERQDEANFRRIEGRLDKLEERLDDTREDVAETTGRHKALSEHEGDQKAATAKVVDRRWGAWLALITAALGIGATLVAQAIGRAFLGGGHP